MWLLNTQFKQTQALTTRKSPPLPWKRPDPWRGLQGSRLKAGKSLACLGDSRAHRPGVRRAGPGGRRRGFSWGPAGGVQVRRALRWLPHQEGAEILWAGPGRSPSSSAWGWGKGLGVSLGSRAGCATSVQALFLSGPVSPCVR